MSIDSEDESSISSKGLKRVKFQEIDYDSDEEVTRKYKNIGKSVTAFELNFHNFFIISENVPEDQNLKTRRFSRESEYV